MGLQNGNVGGNKGFQQTCDREGELLGFPLVVIDKTLV